MPAYTFICDECGAERTIVHAIREAHPPQTCCGKTMRQDFSSIRVAGIRAYRKPIHSDTLAISLSQVAEHQRLFPDIKLDSQCRPVFENYQQHESYLKKCGFVKQPQRSRPKGRRIA